MFTLPTTATEILENDIYGLLDDDDILETMDDEDYAELLASYEVNNDQDYTYGGHRGRLWPPWLPRLCKRQSL